MDNEQEQQHVDCCVESRRGGTASPPRPSLCFRSMVRSSLISSSLFLALGDLQMMWLKGFGNLAKCVQNTATTVYCSAILARVV